MKWKRTAMSLALAGCMMATTVPVTAFAADTTMADEQQSSANWTHVNGTGGEWNGLDAKAIDVSGTSYVAGANVDRRTTVTVEAEINIKDYPATSQGSISYKLNDVKNLVYGVTASHNDSTGKTTFTLQLNPTTCNAVVGTETATLTIGYLKNTGSDAEYTTKAFTLTVGPKVYVDTSKVTYDTAITVLKGGDARPINVDWGTENLTEIPKISWKSADTKIAEVDQRGNVKAVATSVVDTVTVTGVYADKDGKNHTLTTLVTVMDPNGSSIQIGDVINGQGGISNKGAMYVGDTKSLYVKFNNMDTDTAVAWESSNKDVAEVTPGARETATVKALKAGTTQITAKAQVGNQTKTVTFELTVLASGNVVSDVTLNKTEMTLRQGQLYEATDLEGMISDTAARNDLVFDKDGDATVTVGKAVINGVNDQQWAFDGVVVRPVSKDSKRLYVGVNVDVPVGQYTVTLPVTITNADNRVAPFTKAINFTLNVEEADTSIVRTVELFQAAQVTANRNYMLDSVVTTKVIPSSVVDKVVYSIDDTSKAEVVKNEDGYVLITKKAGGFTLTATVGNKSATRAMTVMEESKTLKLNGIKFDENLLSMKAKDTDTLDVLGLVNSDDVYSDLSTWPNGSYDDNIVWASSDEKVATVDGEGKVTALATGTATITARLGSYTASCKVTVSDENSDPNQKPINFVDVQDKNAWYYDAVYDVANKGLMKGVGEDKFNPMGTVERSQVAQIIWNMAGSPTTNAANPFKDVAANAWYAQAVTWAKDKGVVAGITDTTYAPSQVVTRQDFACMLYRYAGSPKTTADLSKYTDASAVSGYATDAVQWAVSKGIISGNEKSQLNPKGTLTRAEAASIISRYTK
ncbi:MAG: S-layer homology domain-containing protein [Eubacteriales bacterium]|nr:S-layer homology domain-containing protein [Eubacteriales bacterium]